MEQCALAVRAVVGVVVLNAVPQGAVTMGAFAVSCVFASALNLSFVAANDVALVAGAVYAGYGVCC